VIELIDVFKFIEYFDILSPLANPKCVFNPTFYDGLLWNVSGPLGLIVGLYVAYYFSRKSWFFDVFMLISFMCYPTLTQQLISYFDCKSYEDGANYLIADSTVKCTDDKYLYLRTWFVFPLTPMVALGVPLTYFMSMYHLRDKLNPPDEEIPVLKDKILKLFSRRKIDLLLLIDKSLQGDAREVYKAAEKAKAADWSLGDHGHDGTAEAVDMAHDAVFQTAGEGAALQWIKILLRAHSKECKATETLWGAYNVEYWWFEVMIV
jgi:hypothetical protein